MMVSSAPRAPLRPLRFYALTALLMFGPAFAAGCGDQVTIVDGTVPDIGFGGGDTAPFPDGDSDGGGPEFDGNSDISKPQPKVKTLTFIDAFGDDQVTCEGVDHCAKFLSFNSKRSISVLYTEDGEPVGSRTVRFKVVNDSDDMGWLSALAAYTSDAGIAEIDTKSTKIQIGQYAVQAFVDDNSVPPLYFDIVITPKSQVPLTVVGTYKGAQQVGSYTVRLYPQVGGKPDCSDIETLFEEGSALISSPNTLLTQSVKFPELPGLETDKLQSYAIMAFSENNQDAVVAWGCELAEVEYGYSQTVEVILNDRPPKYAGPYLVTSYFDFISALPASVQPWIYGLFDIFESPVGGLLSLICNLGGSVSILEDACELIFDDPTNPDIDELSFLGDVIVDVLNSVINGFAQDTIWGDILYAGKDIGSILTEFEVHGTLVFDEEPDDTGHWSSDVTYETWDGITIKWSLDANCDPVKDPDCGKTNIWFSAIQVDDPVEGFFEAQVTDTWWLTIEQHPLNVKYGALLNYVIQKVLLPLLAGDGSDGGPVVDSYAKFFGSLLGGKECLSPGATPCCQAFAESVIDSGASSGVAIIEGACDALIDLGAGLIEDQLLNLDVSTGDAFKIGTKEKCRFRDANNDRIVDTFGSETSPCYWTVNLEFFGSKSTMDGWFHGIKAD